MSIRTATTFWIAAGALSSDSRNQVELTNDLAEFFTDIERQIEIVTMEVPAVGQFHRPLTYRGTDYGQWTSIWRLGLPTQHMGAPSFVDHIIQMNRVQRGNQTVYELRRVVPGSAVHQQLRSQSVPPSGGAGVTAGPGGREWGYFS